MRDIAALIIASTARELARDPDAAALFLDDGTWPKGSGWTAIPENRLDQSRMADSLDAIARGGARAFHEGDLAEAMARDVRDKGGALDAGDLAGYRAWMGDARKVTYRNAAFHVMPGLTAGPTFAHAMAELETRDLSAMPEAYAAYGRASAPVLARLGARIVWRGRLEQVLIGPGEEHWDVCFIAEYPTPGVFAEMVFDPEYRDAMRHRQAAVADSRLIRLAPLTTGAAFNDPED